MNVFDINLMIVELTLLAGATIPRSMPLLDHVASFITSLPVGINLSVEPQERLQEVQGG